MLLLLLLLLVPSSGCLTPEATFECLLGSLDTNHDHQISDAELQGVYDYIHWWQRVPFHVFGGTAQIMRDCDCDEDAYISATDIADANSCLNTCAVIDRVTAMVGC